MTRQSSATEQLQAMTQPAPTNAATSPRPPQPPPRRRVVSTLRLWSMGLGIVLASLCTLHCVEQAERGCTQDADCTSLARKIYCFNGFCSQQQCGPGNTRDCYDGPAGTAGKGNCQTGKQACDTEGRWGACLAQVLPRFEICDRLDNNCDGNVDDDLNCECTPGEKQVCYNGPVGTLLVGQCQSGTQFCENDSLWGKCLDQGLPVPEICDGIDNNCDGKVDEGIDCACEVDKTRTCYNPAFGGCEADKDGKYTCTGSCKAGTQTCQKSKTWGKCEKMQLPSPELCDKLDNNCDGKVDEGLPHNEVCDGKDNDCDGEVDEDPSDVGKACTVKDAKGICAPGRETCVLGKILCVSIRTATPEDCKDGEDNDCNGKIDDGLDCQCKTQELDFDGCVPDNAGCTKDANGTYTCSGQCRVGRRACNANTNKWGTCFGGVPPLDEKCNGLDDNCDGQIDENWKSDLSKVCNVGKGVCSTQGVTICNAEQSGVKCNATPNSAKQTTEVCNDLDDDCDGTIDNIAQGVCTCKDGNTRACGSKEGECEQGQQTCKNGIYGPCVGEVPPTKESCNNNDDDCDGQVDEDFTTLGESCSAGKGQCQRPGIIVCKNGGATCNATPLPSKTEICDTFDNDCDGEIDEGCLCPFGTTRACGTDQGTCTKGIETCIKEGNSSKWGPCVGEIKPKAVETCDGTDEDCDGDVDENLTRPCYNGPAGTQQNNPCQQGVQTCVAGSWGGTTCPGEVLPATKETCGDNKDNNCNGTIDEECVCNDGDTQPCGSTVGECKQGTQTCAGGKWGIACPGEKVGTPEICNNKDDNCDGQVDENYPDLGTACSDGQGECLKQGKKVCKSDGKSTICDAVAGSGKAETCDGLDNDCDGQVDEGITRPCPNAQSCNSGQQCPSGKTCGGEQRCINGSWSEECINVPNRPAETCNGKDDDCDGIVDEGCQCGTCLSNLDCIDSTQRQGICSGSKRCTFACQAGSCPRPFTCINNVCENPTESTQQLWSCENYHAALRADGCSLLQILGSDCGGNNNSSNQTGGVCRGTIVGNCSLYCRNNNHCLTGKNCSSNVCQ